MIRWPNGVDVNANDDRGWSLLHFAAYYDRPEIVEALIEYGAKVNARTNLGLTPLIMASKLGLKIHVFF